MSPPQCRGRGSSMMPDVGVKLPNLSNHILHVGARLVCFLPSNGGILTILVSVG